MATANSKAYPLYKMINAVLDGVESLPALIEAYEETGDHNMVCPSKCPAGSDCAVNKARLLLTYIAVGRRS